MKKKKMENFPSVSYIYSQPINRSFQHKVSSSSFSFLQLAITMAASSSSRMLHVYFFPMMAPGHMIPLVDMARLFAKHGVKATIVTTPLNASQISRTIERDRAGGDEISLRIVEFPCEEAGLPRGCENLASTTSLEMTENFLKAIALLQQPLEKLLEEDQPDCIVAAYFFPWTTSVAAKYGIPRLVFHGSGCFPLSLLHSLKQHKPHQNLQSDSDEFVIPGVPDRITMTRGQLPEHLLKLQTEEDNPLMVIIRDAIKSETESFGVVVNSFHELEPDYAKFYTEVMGRKAWLLGPVSLCNKNKEDKSQRGNHEASFDVHGCMNWLNSKKPNSVIYICFGSMSLFSTAQLLEIAMALKASGLQFIWVIKDKVSDEVGRELKGQGLIVKGWAPQVLILDHEAIGGFMTHCGWNSLMEGISAGVPMATWPLSAEQFFNEKMVTDVLNIGVPVGAGVWSKRTDDRASIGKEKIEQAMIRVMVGEEAEGLKNRARALGEIANHAVEKGGSSESNLASLLEELRSNRN